MTKKNSGLPKAKIIKLLKAKGLTLMRQTYMEQRVWHVTNGKTGTDHRSLQGVVNAYKLEL